MPNGMTFSLEGDANDYFGKGLSGGKLAQYPRAAAHRCPSESDMIIGNVALYGATKGESSCAAWPANESRCATRASKPGVEAVGGAGCEYMTGGRVVVLGPTGRNFAAGMCAGVVAYIFREGSFREWSRREQRCIVARFNAQMVDVERVDDPKEAEEPRALIQKHVDYTGSEHAKAILAAWPTKLAKFVRVMPKDYKRALACLKRAHDQGLYGDEAIMAAFEENTPILRASAVTGEKRIVTWANQRDHRVLAICRWTELAGHRTGDWNEFHEHMPRSSLRQQGARCMDCGVPFCHTGERRSRHGVRLSDQQPDSGVERSRLSRPVARGARSSASRPTTSRSSPDASARRRAKARACSASTSRRSPSRTSSAAIVDKGWDTARLGRAARRTAPARKSRSSVRARRDSRPRPTEQGRAQRDRLRARGSAGRAAHVRHPQHEARQARPGRAPHLAPRGRGGEVPLQHHGGGNRRAGELSITDFDAIVICTGATLPRDLPVEGATLKGVHFAMDFLTASTRSF